MEKNRFTFEEIFEQNERRIHYHLHRNTAYLINDVIYSGPTYEWTLNHIVLVEDALELFDVRIEDVAQTVNV